MSYDVSSLFTQVPLKETVDFIIEQIYNHKRLPKISSNLLFRRLLLKVCQGVVFSFNNRLYKQFDGCGMGNPLSPVLANIFMTMLEAVTVTPLNPECYYRYFDDIFSKKKGKSKTFSYKYKTIVVSVF